MQDRNFPFFSIYADRDKVYDFTDDTADVDEGIETLLEFLDNNEGVYKVEIRKTPIRKSANTSLNFNVRSGSYQYSGNSYNSSKGITGHSRRNRSPLESFLDTTPTGKTLFKELGSRDKNIDHLRNQIMTLQIELIKKENAHAMDLMKRDFEAKSKPDDNDEYMKLAMSAISAYMSRGGGSNLAINGLGDAKIPANPASGEDVTADKIAINKAVVKLMTLDAEFSTHITKLAEIAEKNKAMYDMAINTLNTL